MKALRIINLINFLLGLAVAIFYAYPKCKDVFICLFFFLGMVYFLKLFVEQIALNYGKSIK